MASSSTSTCSSVLCHTRHFLVEGCGNSPCLWYIYGAAYGVLAIATLVQLVRILTRLGEYGWTMQKTFHVLNLVVCTIRAVALCLWDFVDDADDLALQIFLFNLPNLLFFSTYTLLVLFWAEIVQAARPKRMVTPKIVYGVVNVLAYVLSAIFYVLCAVSATQSTGRLLDGILQVVLDAIAMSTFALYGFKLLKMLRKSPVHTAMRQKKICEVALVTVVAVLSFLGKAILEVLALSQKRGLDYEGGMLFDSLFYGLTEVLVIAASLGILSGMPPKRRTQDAYQKIPDGPDEVA